MKNLRIIFGFLLTVLLFFLQGTSSTYGYSFTDCTTNPACNTKVSLGTYCSEYTNGPTCGCPSTPWYLVCCIETTERFRCSDNSICTRWYNHAESCYSNGTPCPCCTRNCGSCTAPTCPSGYTDNSALTACRAPNTTTTSCENPGEDCGDDCGSTVRTCYLLETNTTPSMPASVSIVVDNVTYALSTNSSTPTRIKLPSTLSNVQVTEPTTTFPATSSGGGYAFRGYNDGVNNEWSAIAGCGGVDGEDFCIENVSNTQNFVPTSKTILQVLKQNADGKIAGMYYSQDKCDTDKLYSLPIEGYYQVDNIPVVDIILDLTGDVTAKNCTSNTYTGLDINNPLKFNVTATDADSNDEIEALIIWFSKDTSVPPLVNIIGTRTESNTNDFGIMIRKNPANPGSPFIYSTNADNTWRLLTPADKLAVQGLTLTEGAAWNLSFGLEFKPSANNPSGLYNVYGTVLDSYMINNNVVDQSRIQDLFNWGIDLVNPSVDEITQEIVDVSNFLLTWTASESGSSLKEVVLNGYRTGGQQNSNIELFAPTTYEDSKGYIAAIPIPPEAEIGNMGDHDSSWEFVDRTTYNDLFTAGWFNNNWLYRKPVTVSNITGVARSNEDVLITIDTKELIDNGRLQADCGDLRFLDNNDTTQLSYWVENGCNTTNTNVWVRIPTFPSAGKTIYMYYNNPGASNGTQLWSGEVTMLADSACPSGWARNTDFDGRIPYGSNTYGTTGGVTNHSHAQVIMVTGGSSSGGTARNVAPVTSVLSRALHNHNVTITSQSASIMPPYLTMLFCKKTGLDLTSGLISMFSTASLPSGWTRFGSLDNRYPYGGTTYGATGGSASHTHTLGGTVSAATAGVNTASGAGRSMTPATHTHTLSGTSSQTSNIPSTWQMVFAKNNGSTNSENIVLMVDSLPPVGWNTYTNLTNHFPSGYTSTQDGGGSNVHAHTFSGGLNPGATVVISTGTGTSLLGAPHTHNISGNLDQQNLIPPYRSVIFTERKSSENISIGTELRKGDTWPLVGVTDLKNVTSKINVGDNEGGDINMYVTVYDQACNSSSNFDNIDLNPWMTAKGGTVYSTSGITNASKDVAGLPELDGVFENLTSAELDTGTELISARNDILPELIHPELKGVRALNIYDSNDRKSYWFDHFKEKLATEKSPSAKKIDDPILSACPSGVCYLYSPEDIVIDMGFECKSKLLIMSEGNITINPDITSSSSSTGCIFVAKGNIYVGAGTYKTGVNTNVHYDYLDAYLMAQGQIIFSLVDTDKSVRDGIEINGGMVAFGNGVTTDPAIDVLRNLKLLNISNPTVVTNYDYKYPNMATLFFGVEAPIYKQEIGFKSF